MDILFKPRVEATEQLAQNCMDRMAMDILFKPRVEATEQLAQNCMDTSQSKNQRDHKIASKLHVHHCI